MTTTVKIHRKGQMTLPARLRSLAGIADGDVVEAAFQRGRIVITPKLVIRGPKSRAKDDEYTPGQRRVITASLTEAEKGPYYGPFKNGDEVAVFLKRWKAKTKTRKSKNSR